MPGNKTHTHVLFSKSAYRMNKVLIIGVDGFLGGRLAHYLVQHFVEVVGIGSPRIKEGQRPGWKRLVLPLESSGIRDLIAQENFDLCLYAAGSSDVRASMEAPQEDFLRAVPGWMNILESVRLKCPSCRVLLLSSAAVYGNPASLPISSTAGTAPVSPYGYHKLMCEIALREYAHVYGIRGSSLRIFSAYGDGLRRQVVWDLAGKIVRLGRLMLCGTGYESRDFIHVSDLIEAMLTISARAPLRGESYNVASGEEVTIRQVARWTAEAHGGNIEPEFDGHTPVGIPLNWRADVSPLRALGWTPRVSSERGLKDFARWCLDQQTEKAERS